MSLAYHLNDVLAIAESFNLDRPLNSVDGLDDLPLQVEDADVSHNPLRANNGCLTCRGVGVDAEVAQNLKDVVRVVDDHAAQGASATEAVCHSDGIGACSQGCVLVHAYLYLVFVGPAVAVHT